MANIRTLIADDSAVYRTQIRAALQGVPRVEVVGSVPNGRLALERLAGAEVDLLVLDLEMPELGGLATLAEISRRGLGCRVLVFSSVSREGAESSLEALRLGARDFLAKPGPGGNGESPSARIRALLEPRIQALFPDKAAAPVRAIAGAFPPFAFEGFRPEVVVIGSSTGGPSVLERIFAELGCALRCPVVIAQHMPPVFTTTFAERLARVSGLSVREAAHGHALEPGAVYLAPGDYHLRLEGPRERPILALDQGPLVNWVRPAVDPLFASAAALYGRSCLAIVLTGMGSDGRTGALAVKNAGGAVVIQEERSCVVYGMPAAVADCGAFDLACDPGRIIELLRAAAGAGKGGRDAA